jgi:hypothetical protein
MSRHRKDRGLRTERVTAAYLAQWWNGATVGRGSGKDIVNIPNVDIEVKARSTFSPLEWLRQVKKRTEKTRDLPIVVCRMNGQGEDAGGYLAFMQFSDLVQLLLKAGYGDLQTDSIQLEPTYCQCGNTIMKGSTCPICEKLDNASL